ncbi:MAG: penicillin-binding transpeptidase domain-containing protein, partial [Myxococcota bacterium]
MRSRETRGPGQRVALLRTAFLLLIVALAARASHLVIEQRAKERGSDQTTQLLRIPPARGTIYDREKRELAVTVQAPSVYGIPSEMPDPRVVAEALAPVLGRDPDALERRLRERRSYTFLDRWVSEKTASAVQDLDLPGVGVVREPQRAYPAGTLAGRLLGFTNIDGKGVRGIEQQEDNFLRGRGHAVLVVRDAHGRTLGHGNRVRDTAGGEIALPIDAALQADAEAALMQAVEESGSRGGTVISMVPQTGEILVLAEAPGLDPNSFRHVPYGTTGSGAFLDAVEPGSTLKVFLAAGAIEAG